ncbi:MAG: hypothetical protein ACYC66_01950 [Chloroflexota bacterium]
MRVTLEDLDGSGVPDRATIVGDFLGPNSVLTIYDPVNDLPDSMDWHDLLHTDHATILFDAKGDGNVEQIVQFERNGDSVTAKLYDDRDGDRRVSYREAGTAVKVTESAFPTVRVETRGGWLRADGKLQGNLTFYLDGVVQEGLAWQYPDIIKGQIKNDGSPDFAIEAVDLDGDGNLDYQLLRLLQPYSDLWGLYRAGLSVRVGHGVTSRPEGYLFWPLLDRPGHKWGGNYLDSPPTISVDWDRAKIVNAGIRGYPIESGWHITDSRYIEKRALTSPSFENPMAYYDLAGNEDGFPELHIRLASMLPDDFCFYPARCGRPLEEVRYSWKQYASSDITFDYKLGLAGRHPIEETVAFPDFAVRTVPYEQLPTWVTGRSWDFATFVAVERGTYRSTEGIYDWAPLGVDAQLGYLLGKEAAPPDFTPESLQPGMRGEYTYLLMRQPRLYLSAVDRKLHLAGAEKGFSRLDGRRTIAYRSLDGEQVGSWQLLEDGTTTRALYHLAGGLVYADGAGVRIARSAGPDALWEVAPPTNRDEWERLGDRLRADAPAFAPEEFGAMYDRLRGESVLLSGAKIRDLRPVPGGFRFVLDLPGEARLDGPLPVRGLAGWAGSYLVTYDGADFAAEPLTPPSLSARFVEGADRVAGERADYRVAVGNSGLEDAKAVVVTFSATPAGAASDLPALSSSTVAVPGGGSTSASLQWAPPQPGEWLLRAVVSCGADEEGRAVGECAVADFRVSALGTPGYSLLGLLSFDGSYLFWVAPAAALAGLALALSFALGARKSEMGR